MMADVFDDITRSHVMRQVKSSGNLSTELKFIEYLKEHKISGWRRKSKLLGQPDFVFPGSKIAIFVDGCFWHGHSCKTIPEKNREYWTKKITQNKKRDSQVTRTLRKNGWHVFRFWECHLKKDKYIFYRLNRIKILTTS